jgi:hypothetical protein
MVRWVRRPAENATFAIPKASVVALAALNWPPNALKANVSHP